MTGNPLIKREMELQALLRDLKSEKSHYNENLYAIQDNIRVTYPNEIKQNQLYAKHYADDLRTAESAPKSVDEDGKECYPLKLGNTTYNTRKEAGEALKNALSVNMGKLLEGKEVRLGEYRGLQLSVMYNDFLKKTQACLRGEKPHYCDMNLSTDIGNITRLDNTISNIQKSIDDLNAKIETKQNELEQMKIDVEKPFAREEELRSALAELEDVHIKLTEFELTDDTAQKELFERCVEMFSQIMMGQKDYIKYTNDSVGFMPLHVEMVDDVLSISHTYEQNGDLMYDPRVDFKVDYDNRKVTPISYENSGLGKYEEYDISDPTPEVMRQVNSALTFADDWFDNIEGQGYLDNSTAVDEQVVGRDDVSR